MPFDQPSTRIFYAETYMKSDFFMTAEQMQSINPLLIVLFLPLVNALFTSMANSGWNVRATDKIAVGFILTATTMGIMAYCGYQTGQAERIQKMDANGVAEVDAQGTPVMVDHLPEAKKVSLWWQVVAYFTLTIAEILISVTGLELAFVAAPKNMKSFVTSLWLLTVALANLLLNAPLSQFYPKMHPGNYFAMLAGMMAAVIVIFYFVARRFNRAVGKAQKQAERQMPADEEIITRDLPQPGVRNQQQQAINPLGNATASAVVASLRCRPLARRKLSGRS
ncbi:MAG: hypothetical protein U0744_04685 [Gemmataceae bacterium]